MPIPAMVAGLAAFAVGAIGLGGHLSAQETNEEAEQLASDAKKLYDRAKNSLEVQKSRTEKSLLKLGHSKKEVLEGSMDQFLIAFGRVKNIEMRNSAGIDELSKFMIGEQESLQIREMSNIYQSALSSGTAGAATGAVMALAANGALGAVGTTLMAGEVGMATGIASLALSSSAVSLGAMMTPLATIAAPVVLFTGISSSLKADENLEKAQTMYAEANAAAEKMAVAERICVGISDKADMFNELLIELNRMFSQCTMLLDGVTRKKAGIISKKADFNKFTEDEKKLLAITRSLAGAVKAVIDTPILNEEGEVSEAAEETYQTVSEGIEQFNKQVQYIESCDIKAKPVQPKPIKQSKVSKKSGSNNQSILSKIFDVVRNIFALGIASFLMLMVYVGAEKSLLVSGFTFTISLLLIMNTQTEFKLFRFIRNIGYLTLVAEFGILLYDYAPIWTSHKYFWIADVVAFFVGMLSWGGIDTTKAKKNNNLKRLFGITMLCMALFSLGLPICKVLSGWIGLSYNLVMIPIEILFGLAIIANTYEYYSDRKCNI